MLTLAAWMEKINKEILFIVFLLFIAFILRFIAATNMPLVEDEGMKILLADKISFNLSNLNIPIGDEKLTHSFFPVYLVKLGFVLFGKSMISGRIFFVLSGTLSLCFIYMLVKERWGKDVGLLTLVLLVFDQFHIGEVSLIRDECLLLLFCSMSMYFFFKAIYDNSKFFYLVALSLGLGFLCKEIVLALLAIFAVYALLKKDHGFRFSSKDAWIALFLIIIVITPYLWWCLRNNFINYSNYNRNLFSVGLSLRSFYLYFGEVFIWLEKMNFIELPQETSHEFVFVHWITGILVFLSIIYSFRIKKKKNELVLFCLLMFFIVFFVASFIDPSLLDSHWRASMTIYPGMILSANMLVAMGKKNKYGKLIAIVLIFYFVVHAFQYVTIPDDYGYNLYSHKAKLYLK